MLGCLTMFVCMYFGVIFYLKNQSVEKVITLIIIHGGKGLFLDLTVLTAPISQQCFQCVSCLKFGSKLAGNVNSMQFMLLIKIRVHLQLD